MVPQQALHEARQREKAERERADRFEQALLARSQPPAPAAPTPEPPKVPDFWEAPDQFVNHALTPLQQSMHAQKLDFSRMMAESKFGEDVVKAADTALGDLAKTDRATAEQVAAKMHASRHPYAELVTWHQQEKAKQRVGSDPDAFVQSEIDRIAADPAKRAELLARLTGVPAAVPGADNRPSNITRLPPSLARLPGGNAEPVAGDESLESILHAGRGR